MKYLIAAFGDLSILFSPYLHNFCYKQIRYHAFLKVERHIILIISDICCYNYLISRSQPCVDGNLDVLCIKLYDVGRRANN
jgi:hypothetical protein